jgi:hypothetical protein
MGYYGSFRTERREYVRDLTVNQDTRKCLTKCLRGNVLWSVWERNDGLRYIKCDILYKDEYGYWGHKPLDEDCGPTHYSCPLKYILTLVPINESTSEYSRNWREGVVEYHNSRRK